MSKSTSALYGAEIEGIPQSRIGASVDICRISRGITNPLLAKEAGDINVRELREFEAGERCLPVTQVDKIRKVLGPQTLAALVEEADRTPPLTKPGVATAIYRIALHRDLSIAQLEKDAEYPRLTLQHFVASRTEPEKQTMALEQTYFAAKQMGFKSLGEMLIHERGLDAKLESPLYQTADFRDAVKFAQAEEHLTARIMAHRLGIKQRAYEYMLTGRSGLYFPVPVLQKLPLSLERVSLEDISRRYAQHKSWVAATGSSEDSQPHQWGKRVGQEPQAKRYPVETKPRSR